MDASMVALLLPSCFFALYLILEAADWGLCLAAPLVARNQEENKVVLSLLRPGLDGNEMWFFMGFFMLSTALPDMKGTGMHAWYMGMLLLIGGGAVLRLCAAFLPGLFSSTVMMKGIGLFAFIALFINGLLGTYILMEDRELFTAAGVVCGLWTVLACFQLGSLYGAVKAANPLGERFRASFLISSVVSVILYITLAALLRLELGAVWQGGGYFWMSLIATAILFFAAFFLTRSRHPAPGLAVAYASSFFAIAMYFSAYVMVIPGIHPVDVSALKAGMDAMPGTVVLIITAVWTLSVFVWRMYRKKVEYIWEDHI